jgi:adenosylcobinamide kinase / adenosylcobinamide-phosphate guanylyltransferase
MIYFITGGERSGKSRFAQELALKLSAKPAYLATARRWDAEFERRIARHQAERDERWENLEEAVNISQVQTERSVIVLDCITLWLTNLFTDSKYDVDAALAFARQELDRAFGQTATWVVISNEIGMGVHATTEVGRKFVELQGWVNQHIAARAGEVYLMVSGLSLKVK